MKNALKKIQKKSRSERTPIEQCIIDAVTFEEAEHDGEIETMEQAADDLQAMTEARAKVLTELRKAQSVFDAQGNPADLWMAEKYIRAATDALKGL